MTTRTIQTIAILALATLAAGRAAAQTAPANVTFAIPVNLTRLPAELTRVKLVCSLHSSGLQPGHYVGETELTVLQGEVVQTAQVVVPVTEANLNNASGRSATYECRLSGFHNSPQISIQNAWHSLHMPGNDMVCRLTPLPAPISGSFIW